MHALPPANGEADEEEASVPQLVDESCMQTHCVDSGKLCAVLIAAQVGSLPFAPLIVAG